MSSVEGTSYWCHQCRRTVRVAPSSVGEELSCPRCHDSFLEEMDSSEIGEFAAGAFVTGGLGTDVDGGAGRGEGATDPGHMPPGSGPYPGGGQRARTFPGGHPAFLQVLEAMSAVLQQIQPPGSGGVAEGNFGVVEEDRGRQVGDGAQFNPMLVWQGQMQNLLGTGNVEVFFDNGAGGPPRRLPGNFGDYFLGPGLDQLIQQLAENDPNRYGAPPASKSAVDAMPTIQISPEHLGTDAAHCAVCKDEFEVGCSVKQMPCKHMYHGECILPWLSQHNSCPVCRYEMPTDDPDYNQARAAQQRPAADADPGTASREGAGNRGSGFLNPRSSTSAVSTEPTATTTTGSVTPGISTTVASSGGRGGLSAPSMVPSRRISFHLPWPFRSSPLTLGDAASSSRGNENSPAGEVNAQPTAPRRNADEEERFTSHSEHEELD